MTDVLRPILFIVLLLGGAQGAEGRPLPTLQRADTTEIVVRTPQESTLAPYRADSDYVYESRSGTSWWDQFWSWVFDQLDRTANVPWATELLYGLAILVMTGMFLFAARWLFRMRPTAPMERRSSLAADAPVTREELETLDFRAEAEAAEADGAYRRAVRFRYLDLLQHLVQANLVDWTPDKANRELVRETRDTPVHDPFDRSTKLFEVVWYGDVSINRMSYEQVRDTLTRARTAALSTEDPNPPA